eukprot:803326-Pelagomonas_calceolata.AAC.5
MKSYAEKLKSRSSLALHGMRWFPFKGKGSFCAAMSSSKGNLGFHARSMQASRQVRPSNRDLMCNSTQVLPVLQQIKSGHPPAYTSATSGTGPVLVTASPQKLQQLQPARVQPLSMKSWVSSTKPLLIASAE